ncbi:MAG: hypothetical protein ABIS17_15440 [Casimicrobiaceae bacterium]
MLLAYLVTKNDARHGARIGLLGLHEILDAAVPCLAAEDVDLEADPAEPVVENGETGRRGPVSARRDGPSARGLY